MLMKRAGSGVREIGRFLKRSSSTFSNEIALDLGCEFGYTLPWLTNRHTVCEPSPVGHSTYTQEQLDEIAWSLNTHLRKSLGFRTPVAVYNELLLNMELAKSATKH